MSNNFQTTSTVRGFTLIEVMTALTITMLGIIGVYGLINQTLVSAQTSSMKLTAAYLGKEGIEIVKNIRDTNYLKAHYDVMGYSNQNRSWKSGLASRGTPVAVDCSSSSAAGGCGGDYLTTALDPALAQKRLKFDGNFFNYSSPEENNTPYTRKITVNEQGNNGLEIIVEVGWTERGRIHSLIVQENIYNWWPN